MASKANRAGVAERVADPAVHKRIAVARARISDDDARRRDVARTVRTTAPHPDAHTLSRLPTVPGIGTIRSRGWRYESHAITRCPTGPGCCLLRPAGHMCPGSRGETRG